MKSVSITKAITKWEVSGIYHRVHYFCIKTNIMTSHKMMKGRRREKYSKCLRRSKYVPHIKCRSKLKIKNEFTSVYCILLGPATGCCLVLGRVSLVHMSNLRNKRVIRIWIRQQRADWQQDLIDKQQTDQVTNKS